MRSTRTTPVSTSTSTSANCAPKVASFIPSGFGPRLPRPMIITSPSFAADLGEGHRALAAASRCTTPSRASSCFALTPSSPGRRLEQRLRASSAAMRTAGPDATPS